MEETKQTAQLEKINGFTPEEIYALYSFLNVYEEKEIKKHNETDLTNCSKILEELKSIISSFNADEKNKDELSQIETKSLNDEFYFTRHKSKLLGVLYHLRNSIAHGKIYKEDDIVMIEDFEPKEDNPQHTAKGKLSYKTIEKIILVTKSIQ